MTRSIVTVGPEHDGRRMSLAEFELAEGREGFNYELGQGVVSAVDVPDRINFAQLDSIRQQLSAYRVRRPDRIYGIAGGAECKIVLSELESERHPDVAVYSEPPPDENDDWSGWIPDVTVEVVSAGSEHRDYVEKREEYLRFGVKEYWIVDIRKQELLVLRRSRGRWIERTIRPEEIYKSRLLPGFEFDLSAVFEAAER